MTKNKADLLKEIAELNTSHKLLDAELKKRGEQHRALLDRWEETVKHCDTLDTRLQTMTTNFLNLKQEHGALKQRNNRSVTKNDKLHRRAEQAKNSNRWMLAELTAARSNIETYQSKMVEGLNANSALFNTNNELKGEIARLKTELSNTNDTVQRYKHFVDGVSVLQGLMK